jgi:hypothetical protein
VLQPRHFVFVSANWRPTASSETGVTALLTSRDHTASLLRPSFRFFFQIFPGLTCGQYIFITMFSVEQLVTAS